MSRSSIFSFDTLKLDRKLPAGLLVCVAVLLVVEFGLARQDWTWGWIAQSPSGIFDAIETQLIEPAEGLQVVVMGSSRIQDGVSPRGLEKELGLPEGSAISLAMTSGRPFDALMLYERHREKFSKARVLVMEVAEFQFNGGFSPSERERRFATLDQRLSLYDPQNTRSMLAGWVWRTYDAQGPLRRLIKSAVKKPVTKLALTEDGRINWRNKTLEEGPETIDAAPSVHKMYHRFYMSQARLENLHKLVELAREDGLDVMLVQMPVRDSFVDIVEKKHADDYAAFVAATDKVPGVRLHRWVRGSELGLKPTDYYDYGHVTNRGSRAITTALGQKIKADFPGAFKAAKP